MFDSKTDFDFIAIFDYLVELCTLPHPLSRKIFRPLSDSLFSERTTEWAFS